MAQNKLPPSNAELLDLGTHCLQGLTTQGTPLGILQYTPATFGPKVSALSGKQVAFNQARASYAAAFGPLHTKQGQMRKACLDGRKLLSITLGDDWSPAWVAPGWPDQTTEVPGSLPDLKALCTSLSAFLTQLNDYEVITPLITFTAARFDTLLTGLAPVENALAGLDAARGLAKGARKEDDRALRQDLRGLIALLGTILDPNSPLWDAFGLNRPGASVTPAQAAVPVLTKVPGGKVLAQSAVVSGATYYRWFAQVVGVDADFRFLGRTQDALKEIEDLPTAGTLNVKLQAANEAGPGKASPVATMELS